MGKDSIKYVVLQPMSEGRAKLCFKGIVPEDLDHFIVTKQAHIKDEMMEAKTLEKMAYLRGRYKGLGEFRDMIAKFAKATRKEEELSIYREVTQHREDKRSQKGLIIKKK